MTHDALIGSQDGTKESGVGPIWFVMNRHASQPLLELAQWITLVIANLIAIFGIYRSRRRKANVYVTLNVTPHHRNVVFWNTGDHIAQILTLTINGKVIIKNGAFGQTPIDPIGPHHQEKIDLLVMGDETFPAYRDKYEIEFISYHQNWRRRTNTKPTTKKDILVFSSPPQSA